MRFKLILIETYVLAREPIHRRGPARVFALP